MSFSTDNDISLKWYLGCFVGGGYHVAPDAANTLASITKELQTEDKSLRSFRQSLALCQLAGSDLAPILHSTGSHLSSHATHSRDVEDTNRQLQIFTNVVR